MTTILPEITNPLSRGKLVGCDVSEREYSKQVVERGHPGFRMSRSELHDFADCPHKWFVGRTPTDTDATLWGTLFEFCVQYPGSTDDRFAITPPTYHASAMECPSCKSRTDSLTCRKCQCDRVRVEFDKPWDFGANVCAKWKENHQDQTIIKSELLSEARNAAEAFFGNPELSSLANCSQRQVMVEAEYHDESTNLVIPIHSLIDFVPEKTHLKFGQSLADLKTTKSAKPFSFARDVFSHWLHVQAALYLDVWNACGADQRIEWRLLVSESEAPWEATAYLLSQDYITLGRMTYIQALQRYCRCLTTKSWPGYADPERDNLYDGWALIEPETWMVNR